jgi:hypothetical protein
MSASGTGASLFGRGSSSDAAPMRGEIPWRTREQGIDLKTGLVKFIADLRNARARELEEKRINKELANIR